MFFGDEMNSIHSEYDINDLYQEAQSRWLKPAEVYFILQNHEKYKITQEPAKQPPNGSLFLFNKRVLRFFRRDGHNWRKKKDGRTVGEAHERLKVGNVESLNCYYAHGEDNNCFQRRSYWMLDPVYEHIVLVHYRDIAEGSSSSVSPVQLSSGSLLSFSQSPSPGTPPNAGSISVSDYRSSASPGSVEVSSDTSFQLNGSAYNNSRNGSGELSSSTEFEVSHALRKLEEQLSLNDDTFQDFSLASDQIEDPNVSDLLGYKGGVFNQDQFTDFPGTQNVVQNNYYSSYSAAQGGNSEGQHQYIEHDYSNERKESLSWKDVLDACHTSGGPCEQSDLSLNRNKQEFTGDQSNEKPEQHKWQNSSTNSVDHTASPSICQEVNSIRLSQYPCASGVTATDSDYYGMMFNPDHIGAFEPDISLTIAQKQKFKIQEISPGWGYASESTKILIVGSFLCDSSESSWNCMFGDVEVPAQIIQDGVIRCEAPTHPPGKVTLCITTGNRESCSEVREFEYRLKGEMYVEANSTSSESMRSPEELLFLARFIQMLLLDSSVPKKDVDDVDSFACVIEALSFGSGTSSSTVDWLLEELLKDKVHSWISSKSLKQYNQTGCPLSRKEQGIIHLVAGLGFEWALSPILSAGVSVNFRDIKGWTALHWAARFGREKMVAALIASGASAGAVTDPTSVNRTGETAASIAATSGHKGLAGYLSEVALTSHLSSLTLRESELSKGSAEVEAEKTVNSISRQNLMAHGDHISLKHTLAAVRNAAQAAARIQSAFRAHSFRRRQDRDASVSSVDEYGMNADDIQELSAMSKLRNPRDHNSAALSIQKKYRGYKGRKDYLTFRQNVVKIQAYVRGYQVRKHYKVFCWAVGVLEKVVLRWRRKGVGLRGFRPETDSIDESEDEDILKAFRKQKVDGTINQAISRVLSMVKSTEARQQYHRVLEKYCQAKAELGGTSNEAADANDISEFYDAEDFDMFPFP